MKNRKRLTYALGVLFTLIALAVVGVAGFRVGMMQNVPFARIGQGNGPIMQGINPGTNNNNSNPNDNAAGNNNNGKDNFGGGPQFMQGNSRGYDFNNRGFDRVRGGISIFGGLFGLIHIAVLALLLWFGYKLVQNSGWRLVRVQATPATTETSSVEVEEKKE